MTIFRPLFALWVLLLLREIACGSSGVSYHKASWLTGIIEYEEEKRQSLAMEEGGGWWRAPSLPANTMTSAARNLTSFL